MTLADKVFAYTRQLTAEVMIDGVLITQSDPTTSTGVPGWDNLHISKSMDNPVPVCSIQVNRVPSWVRRGQEVIVNLGYDGLTQRVFTGHVQDRSPGVGRGTINCMGKLFAAFRTIEIAERDVDGITVEAAIEGILDYVDITDRVVDVPAWTLGSASDAKLSRMPASQMLQMLMDIDGCRIREMASGVVYVQQLEELPASDAFRTYTTTNQATARILGGGVTEDPSYVRTRVMVTGAHVVEGAPPNETSRDITATATLVGGSDLVQPPLPAGSFIDAEYGNSLIDTDAKAAETAERMLARYARVPKVVELEIGGDPQIDIAMTVALDFPLLNLSDNWFVSGISHVIDVNGYRTQLQLKGGAEYGGSLRINPIAAFTVHTEYEVMGVGVYIVATFDASGSYDPDGSISSYAWSDNQVTTPEIAGLTTSVVTVRAATGGWAGAWTVTLTVTDNDGLTGALSIDVPYDPGDPGIPYPAMLAALDNHASGTPDGGQSWNDQVSANCVSCGAKPPAGDAGGVGLFGYTDGSIKLTTDGCQSALTTVLAAAPAQGTINHILWDRNLPSRVWAVTSTGQVWHSNNNGANGTWYLYKDFGGGYPLARVLTPPGLGVWVVGGRGDDPTTLIQYDALVNGGWQSVAIGGELATDIAGSAQAVTVADAAMRETNELCIIFKGAALAGGAAVALYYSSNIRGDGSDWKRGTGLAGGLVEGRYVVPDLAPATFRAAFNNRDVWRTVDGVAWVQNANVLPANTVPWHAIWVGEVSYMPNMSGVYLVAAEETVGSTAGIYKSSDGLASAQALRPVAGYPAWPGAAIGRMVSIGTQKIEADILALMRPTAGGVSDGTSRTVKCEKGVWTQQESIADNSYHRLYRFMASDGASYHHWRIKAGAAAQRSIDQGVTWVNKLGECYDICRAADGRLWACTDDPAHPGSNQYTAIRYSDDDGDNWTTSIVYDNSPLTCYLRDIAAHPTDPNVIAALGYWVTGKRMCYTLNRGVGWSRVTPMAGVANTSAQDIEILQNGRFVVVSYTFDGGAEVRVAYADDPSGAWTAQDLESHAPAALQMIQTLFHLFISYQKNPNAPLWHSINSAADWGSLGTMPWDYVSAMHYAIGDDAFYIGSNHNLATGIVYQALGPTSGSLSWADISGNLLAAMGGPAGTTVAFRGFAAL